MSNRKKIFTDEALAAVVVLIAQGLSKKEIAAQLGCKPGSLQTICCKRGISLRSPSDPRKPKNPKPPPQFQMILQVPLPISDHAMTRLRERAAAKGVTAPKLAATLLELIAIDDLYDAVLDVEENE